VGMFTFKVITRSYSQQQRATRNTRLTMKIALNCWHALLLILFQRTIFASGVMMRNLVQLCYLERRVIFFDRSSAHMLHPLFIISMPNPHPFITWLVESNNVVCLKYA
jgi:hypothetical protein